jgi:hypothetical protein
MPADEIIGGFRHIKPDGSIAKVMKNKKTGRFFIKFTGEEIEASKVTRSFNIQKGKVVKSKRKNYGYDEWWEESNLDGSFAYNGVTDDF